MTKTTDTALTEDHRQLAIRIITDNANVVMAEVAEERRPMPGALTLPEALEQARGTLGTFMGEKPPAVTGVARCCPTDTFDPTIGKALAISRALRRVAEQYEDHVPESYRDPHPAERRAEQLDRERQHWRDRYAELTEKLGYPMDGNDPDSNLLRHARTEMSKAGLYDEDSDYGGMLGQAVEDLVRVFQAQGHSGLSAHIVMDLFKNVASFKTLTPLTDDPDEWMQVSPDMMPDGDPTVWQSRRRPDAFSNDGGKSYYLLDDEPRQTYDSATAPKKDPALLEYAEAAEPTAG